MKEFVKLDINWIKFLNKISIELLSVICQNVKKIISSQIFYNNAYYITNSVKGIFNSVVTLLNEKVVGQDLSTKEIKLKKT